MCYTYPIYTPAQIGRLACEMAQNERENLLLYRPQGNIAQTLTMALVDAVERHITEYGVTDFLVGNYGAFDRMSARTVREAKTQHLGIHLHLMLPYRSEMGRPLPDQEGYDNFVYPEGIEDVLYKLAIPRLNRIMVRDSAYVIHSWGGAATTLEFAARRQRMGKLIITNLGE